MKFAGGWRGSLKLQQRDSPNFEKSISLTLVLKMSNLNVAGILQEKHTEADRVQVLERRKVFRREAQPESLSVLQIQEVPGRRNVQRL